MGSGLSAINKKALRTTAPAKTESENLEGERVVDDEQFFRFTLNSANHYSRRNSEMAFSRLCLPLRGNSFLLLVPLLFTTDKTSFNASTHSLLFVVILISNYFPRLPLGKGQKDTNLARVDGGEDESEDEKEGK